MKLVNLYVWTLLTLIVPAYRLHSQQIKEDNAVVWFRLSANAGINDVISTLRDTDPVCTASLRLLFPKHQHTKELSGIYEVVFRNSHLSDAALLRMHKLSVIAFAEKKPVIRSFYTPNDLLASQWHLSKTRAEDAWDIARGSAAVTVAVVDDFFDLTHPDLQNVWQFNSGEVPGNNIDDDGNGYTDDYFGWNANYNHPNIMPPALRRSLFSHGTHCAGIVGARTDNGTGIASIGFGLKILGVAVGDSINPGRMGNAYQGVVYAADRGAPVISLSWGSYTSSITGQLVINYAHNRGAIIFAAAGNDNTDIPVYPAAYNHVVAVAATDVNDRKSPFSNYGSWVDLSAPGSAIMSTITGTTPGYGNMSGTSMATPLAAGLAGLMLSHNPQLTAADLEVLLKKNVFNHYGLNPGYTGKLGSGRIDAASAIQSVLKLKALFAENKRSICPQDTIRFQFNGYGSSLSYRWSFSGGNPATSSIASPAVVYTNPGLYDVQLIIDDGTHSDTILKKAHIQVSVPTANMSTDTPVANGNTLFLKLNLTGQAPWRIRMKLIDSTRWFTADQSPFYIEHKASKSGVFKILAFSDSRCSAPESDSIKLRVFTTPSPGPDSCYLSVNKKRIQTLFSYAYGSSGREAPTGLIVLSDSNYLLYGTTTGFGSGGEDLMAVKINRNGQIIWTRAIGLSGFDGGLPASAKEMSNGDIVIAGASSTGSGRWQGTVVRLTSSGALRWSRIYPALTAHDHLRGLTELPDGSIIVVGTSGQPSNQSASLIRFTANGTQSWKRMHDYSGIAEHYIDVHHIRNRLYIFGSASRGTGGISSIMSKTNLSGDKIWEYRFETSGGNLLMYAAPAADNSGFACTGYGFVSGTSSNVQAHISFVDTNGTLLWMKDFGGTGIERLTAITRGADNDFYAIGWTQSKDVVAKLMIIRFDKNGNIKWDRIYGAKGTAINTPDFGAGIARDVNDGIVTASIVDQSNPDALLMSVNHCGESSCYSEKASFTFRSLSVSRSDAQTSDLTGNTPSNWSVTVGNHNSALKKRELCPEISNIKCDLNAAFTFTQQCTGDTLNFRNNTKDANGFPLSFFSWLIDDTTMIPGVSDLAYAFTKPGKHKVTLFAWSHNDYLCKDTFVCFISVSDSIKVRAGGNSGRCIGDTVRLFSSVLCGKPPFKFRWFRNTVQIGDSSLLAIVPNAAAWYKIKVTDAANLSAEDSIYVSVDPACCKHNASLAVSGNAWRCHGDSITFINQSVNAPGTAYNWRYETPGGVVTHNGATSIALHAKQTGRYAARLIAESSTCRADTAYIDLKVLALPLAYAGPDTVLCTADTVVLGNGENLYQHSYNWTPASGLDNPGAYQTRATINGNAVYVLEVRNEATGCTGKDSIAINILDKIYFQLDTSICAGDSVLIFHTALPSLQWNTGIAANPFKIKQAGLYWLKPIAPRYCPPSDTLRVRIKPLPPFPQLTGDTLICTGSSAVVYPATDTSTMTARWDDGITQFKRIFHTPGIKRLTIRANGCPNSDSIRLVSANKPIAPALRDTILCTGDSLVVNLPDNGLVYAWNDGFTGRNRILKLQGTYKFKVSNLCGSDSSDVTITHKNVLPPALNITSDTGFCINETFELNLSQTGTDYTWNDGYTGGKRIFNTPGVYIVSAENECYSSTDSIRLRYLFCDCHVFLPDAFTPEGDGLNDFYKTTTDCLWEDFEMKIYNRWGEKIFSTRDVNVGWDGRFNGKYCPDGVYVCLISGIAPQSGFMRRYTESTSFHLIR